MSDDLSAIPEFPATNLSSRVAAAGGIKPATPDIIIFNEDALPVDAMANLIFEDIGGHEIINMMRHDTVDGKNVNYSLISNANKVDSSYNPLNLVGAPGTLSEYFKNFPIRLETHTIETESVNRSAAVYVDRNVVPGSLVLEVTGMEVNEQIEVQVLNSGTYLDGII